MTKLRSIPFQFNPLWVAVIMGLGSLNHPAQAQTQSQAYNFGYSADVLKAGLGGQDIDLSFFEQGLSMAPGIYKLDVYLNQDIAGTYEVEIKNKEGRLTPSFSVGQLKELGINVEALESLSALDPSTIIDSLHDYIPELEMVLDEQALRLDLTVAQAFLISQRKYTELAPSHKWDQGVTALMLGYDLTGSRYKTRASEGSTNDNAFLSLNAQLNFLGWQLYSSGSFSYNQYENELFKYQDHNWDFWNTYLERDIPLLRSRLKLGELNTNGDLFESFSMRGAVLEFNESMFPSVDRSFMPRIRGTANSFAVVSVRQNGRVVYQTNVAPGPFVLDDLPNLGNEGDLEVVIKEADGTERIEFYPYTALPLMLKEDQWRYHINIGRYYRRATDDDTKEPWFAMGTISYGLPYDITAFGGALLSENYQSIGLGASLSMGSLGALSVDTVQMRAAEDRDRGIEEQQGAAYRIKYAKSMNTFGTTLNLMNYRYLTDQYFSFQEINDYGSEIGDSYWLRGRLKDRWQAVISQSLGKWGHISLSGSLINYHGDENSSKNWQVIYSHNIEGVGLNLSYSRDYIKHDGRWEPDQRIMFNVNIPFSLFMPEGVSNSYRNISAGYQLTMNDNDGGSRYSQQASLSGHIDGWNTNWQVHQTLGQKQDQLSSVMLGYNGDKVGGSLSYSRTHTSDTYTFGLSGGFVAHSGGITAMSRAYDSVAIVEVGDLSGVKINQAANVYTDWFGNAVVTNLRNYAANDIVVDPTSLPEGTILPEGTNQTVYPMTGSIVKVKYAVREGRQVIFLVENNEGVPLPFGAQASVRDEKNNQLLAEGIVGEEGRLYMTGIPAQGQLSVQWFANGQKQNQNYQYSIPTVTNTKEDNIERIARIKLKPSHQEIIDATKDQETVLKTSLEEITEEVTQEASSTEEKLPPLQTEVVLREASSTSVERKETTEPFNKKQMQEVQILWPNGKTVSPGAKVRSVDGKNEFVVGEHGRVVMPLMDRQSYWIDDQNTKAFFQYRQSTVPTASVVIYATAYEG